MPNIEFTPWIDLPLAGAAMLAFWMHYNVWSRKNAAQASVSLSSRLPTARLRLVLLFSAMVFFCWGANVAVWFLFAILLTLGLVVAITSGEIRSSGISLIFPAYAIREWSFGFPHLILHPPEDLDSAPITSTDLEQLLGMHGTAATPIRPVGNARLGEVEIAVTSETGEQIDAGTPISVTRTQNGKVYVRSTEDSQPEL